MSKVSKLSKSSPKALRLFCCDIRPLACGGEHGELGEGIPRVCEEK